MTVIRKGTVALVCLGALLFLAAVKAAPQGQAPEKPMPYEYKYDVKDQEKNLFFGANELGDDNGKVTGAYKVLLPDGRLMVVEYSVEGESGFVPKISFEENAKPF